MKNYHFSHSQQSNSPDLTYHPCDECGHRIVLNNPCLLNGKLVYILYCDICFNGEDTYVVFDLTEDELKALFLAGIPILDDVEEVETCDQ